MTRRHQLTCDLFDLSLVQAATNRIKIEFHDSRLINDEIIEEDIDADHIVAASHQTKFA